MVSLRRAKNNTFSMFGPCEVQSHSCEWGSNLVLVAQMGVRYYNAAPLVSEASFTVRCKKFSKQSEERGVVRQRYHKVYLFLAETVSE